MRSATFVSLAVALALVVGGVGLAVRNRSDARARTEQTLTTAVGSEAAQLEAYFARARAINLITAHNPAFADVYRETGARAAKVRSRTRAVRQSEAALAFLERLYPASIGEACFIDAGGAENARFVNGMRAPFATLSKNESLNLFFKPTFALPPGQVYQAKPYISADTHEWVISNSTPVPGTGFPAAAIVHFEITVESFRRAAAELANGSEIAIVDADDGSVVIDSRLPQRRGVALGRPDDRRFTGLLARGTSSGTMTVGGHQAAFRRLDETAHNANHWYVVALDPVSSGTILHGAGWPPLAMFVAALALLGLSLVSLRTSRRALGETEAVRTAEAKRNADERRYHETQREFTEVMQITRDEDEAYQLLKRHLERSLPGSEVLVLNRNNSHDRLQPMTALAEDAPLAARLKDAVPESCLAVRLGKAFERCDGCEPLLDCELCVGTEGYSTCVPSLVGGEVIGSVLVQHPAPLDGVDARRVEESMTQASPVLANLRNLALSQTRALTDGLTGLPNRRSLEDALKRIVAQAGRTETPLGLVLFDLDHFKQVNDLYGHEKGDEVLAVVGATIASTVRASDFAGRFGGEEFLLFLPDTDSRGAAVAAETLREAIARLEIPGVPRPITASFGVASLPEDAAEPATLLRAADRALYMAKAQGRNRVESFVADGGAAPLARES